MPAPISIQFAVAVHVLTYLAGASDSAPVGSPALAGSVNTSPEYIRRVMIPLRAAGIVSSTAGKNGGWLLQRDPSTLTLAEVWQLVQADEPTMGIHDPNPSCTVGRSIAQALITIEQDIADAVTERLGATTIAHLLESAQAE
ncbi:Rrf2 family transcriptional regulator [Mycobacterium sp. 21AC1]|uniref:Rrf2 family transcriptional regulator n=1 Tax=[Mycobacterium] appelbergii TaxID=2939269 RepID=UPI002938ED09|nr:Rrf2 family transcriptional regulator [Mycobacterium sp. 21AC1]MDV3126031.1 Rrf2 family transcriptional regulator [Mycobacterium sp. 21AC1]